MKPSEGTYFNSLQNLYRVFLLFPNSNNRSCHFLLSIFSFCLIFFQIFLLFCLIQIIFESPSYSKRSIGNGIIFSIYALTIFNGIFISIQMICKRQQHTRIFSQFESIDKLLQTVNGSYHLKKDIKFVLRRTYLLIFFIVTCVMIYNLQYTMRGNSNFRYVVVGGILNRVFCVMYDNYMVMVIQRLDAILKNVEQKRLWDSVSAFKIILGMESQPISSSHRDVMHHLKIVYSKLWKIADQMDEIFGYCILLNVLLLVYHIVTNLYWIILKVMGYSEDVFLNISEAILLLIPNSMLLILLNFDGERCILKVRNSSGFLSV